MRGRDLNNGFIVVCTEYSALLLGINLQILNSSSLSDVMANV